MTLAATAAVNLYRWEWSKIRGTGRWQHPRFPGESFSMETALEIERYARDKAAHIIRLARQARDACKERHEERRAALGPMLRMNGGGR